MHLCVGFAEASHWPKWLWFDREPINLLECELCTKVSGYSVIKAGAYARRAYMSYFPNQHWGVCQKRNRRPKGLVCFWIAFENQSKKGFREKATPTSGTWIMITKLLTDSPNHAGVPLVPMGFKGPRDARVEIPSHILVTKCSRAKWPYF